MDRCMDTCMYTCAKRNNIASNDIACTHRHTVSYTYRTKNVILYITYSAIIFIHTLYCFVVFCKDATFMQMNSFDARAPCEIVCDERLFSSSLWSLLCCCDQSLGSKGLKLRLAKKCATIIVVFRPNGSLLQRRTLRLLVTHP